VENWFEEEREIGALFISGTFKLSNDIVGSSCGERKFGKEEGDDEKGDEEEEGEAEEREEGEDDEEEIEDEEDVYFFLRYLVSDLTESCSSVYISPS
jgi:hypothetical protein